jgi:hypothetical protein
LAVEPLIAVLKDQNEHIWARGCCPGTRPDRRRPGCGAPEGGCGLPVPG